MLLRIGTVLLVLLGLPGFASADSATSIGVVTLSGLHAADWYTTKVILAQGGRELNPLMQGTNAKRAAMKAAIGGAQASTLLWLAKDRRARPAARVAAWMLVGVQGAIVVHNARTVRR